MKPYLIRGIYEWIADNQWTPYMLVNAEDESSNVPMQHVNDGKIILNIRDEAVQQLRLGNELIEFNARFGGSPMHVSFMVDSVLGIYAKENGQGMVFDAKNDNRDDTPPDPPPTPPQEKSKRPNLRIVK
ncbi:MAG: ClpXP protease specificity-enhancing factor [Methylococcales bacterium]